MRRTVSRICKPLAATTMLTSLAACATITGENVQTEMIVANHTASAITVSYAQNQENADPSTIGLEQLVLPDGTIRYSGKAGDTVVVQAGNEPPLTLVFARRSQVVKVSESSSGVAFNVTQGYTDPDRH